MVQAKYELKIWLANITCKYDLQICMLSKYALQIWLANKAWKYDLKIWLANTTYKYDLQKNVLYKNDLQTWITNHDLQKMTFKNDFQNMKINIPDNTLKNTYEKFGE